MASLTEIRDHYIRHVRPGARVEAAHYAQGDLEDRIQRATLARNSKDKRHSHQRRIPEATLKRFSKKLLTRSSDLERAEDFVELMELVESERIKGIGELTVYDTALRIGRAQDGEPKEVYLHAGTRKGAKRLFGRVRGKSIPRRQFPAEFKGLSAGELEDLLCIYAKYIGSRRKLPSGALPCGGANNGC